MGQRREELRLLAKTGFLLALALSAGFAGGGGGTAVSVAVTNPLSLARDSDMVVLPWAELRKGGLDRKPVAVFAGNERLPSQLVDYDADGNPEELIFLSSFEPMETKQFAVRNDDDPQGHLPRLTDARFVEPRQDLAWESDRIAYRMYGPALAKEVNNGVDVWTKRVRYPIVEKWYKANEGGTSGKDTYHADHGEGADFFSVGRSLGCGGSAIWSNGSLHQPGVFSRHKIIVAGPLRAVFELTYDPVTVDGKQVTEVRRVTLDAGQNLNKFAITYTSAVPNDVLQFACGLVKRRNTASARNERSCWLSLWGQTNDDPVNGSLGTGILLPRESFVSMSEDSVQYLMLGTARSGIPVTYFAGAGWTRTGDFRSEADWETHLERFSEKLKQPLRIRVSSPKK